MEATGHSHEQRTLFRILVRFWWPIIDKEVDQFILACAHFQLVDSCSQVAHQIIHTIESDTPFDLKFPDFWDPGDISNRDGYCKILTLLDCMTRFGLELYSRMNQITPY